MMQLGLFNKEIRLEKLSKLGDSLEKLNVIDWEMFRPMLNSALRKEHKGSGGRPPYDYLLLFKTLILQRLFNLSDDQTELPNQRPHELYALSRLVSRRQDTGCKNHMALSRHSDASESN